MKKGKRAFVRAVRCLAAALAAAMLSVLLGGCNIITLVRYWGSDSEQMLESELGDYRLTMNRGWSDMAGELGEGAVLEAADPIREKYVMIFAYSREDFEADVTLTDFADWVAEGLMENLSDPVLSREPDADVLGGSAPSCQVIGGVDGLNITYWVTCAATDDEYFQIVGWTLKSKAEDNKEDIQQVMHSLQVG